ncbi:hypothetical protein MJG53_002125 [Ovis ammon polii x Ovis aries]|uniref:Uncharacterized protein n=1 Tax=Ovis ammon polii x Ovis aries TaxID=2918886 RepID=A0ACB9VM30_9CETA|nr:hypothetical protein MJG53_002125 [Ovis ammon polii x Ovis aries]
MNTFLLSALCLLGAWATLTGGVIVQDGDFSFSLESVKKLKDLQELQEPRIPRNPVGPITSNLCSLPTFPEELKPLCKEPNAQEILDRLDAQPCHCPRQPACVDVSQGTAFLRDIGSDCQASPDSGPRVEASNTETNDVSNTQARAIGSSSFAVVTHCIPFGTVLFLDVDNITFFFLFHHDLEEDLAANLDVGLFLEIVVIISSVSGGLGTYSVQAVDREDVLGTDILDHPFEIMHSILTQMYNEIRNIQLYKVGQLLCFIFY